MTRAAAFFAAIRDLILGTSGNRMTNWNEGGPIESLARGTAAQLEAESFRVDTMYRNLYGVTASGADLDLRMAEAGLKRKPLWKARGYVRFYKSGADIPPIPSGTRVATADPRAESDAVEFATLVVVVQGVSGSYVDVLCEALVAGASGNVAAGQVVFLVDTVAGIGSVVNPGAMAGGAEAETDPECRARLALAPYRAAIGQPTRTWESLALDVVGVAKASCISCWAGSGTFKIIIWSRDGDGELVPASAELVTAVDDLLQTYVVVGTELTVAAASGPGQDVTVYIETTNFESDAALVKAAIEALFPVETLVAAAIVEAAMGAGTVTDVRLGLPLENVTVAGGSLYAGVIRVLPMEWDGYYL